jgi:hypothetical protein
MLCGEFFNQKAANQSYREKTYTRVGFCTTGQEGGPAWVRFDNLHSKLFKYESACDRIGLGLNVSCGECRP